MSICPKIVYAPVNQKVMFLNNPTQVCLGLEGKTELDPNRYARSFSTLTCASTFVKLTAASSSEGIYVHAMDFFPLFLQQNDASYQYVLNVYGKQGL